jgi:hypothetical protein
MPDLLQVIKKACRKVKYCEELTHFANFKDWVDVNKIVYGPSRFSGFTKYRCFRLSSRKGTPQFQVKHDIHQGDSYLGPITCSGNLLLPAQFTLHHCPDTWTDLLGNVDATIPIADRPLNFNNTFGKFPTFPPYIARSLKPVLKKTSNAQKQGALVLFDNGIIVIRYKYETLIIFHKVWLHPQTYLWKWLRHR